MIEHIWDTAFAVLPPESPEGHDARSAKRHRVWRRGVFTSIVLLAGFLGYGMASYATDEDVEIRVAQVASQISAAIKQSAETEKKVEQLNAQVYAQNQLIVQKVASDLEQKIIDSKARMCKSKEESGVRYFNDIVRDLIAQYESLTKRYDKRWPTCAEL